MKDFKYSKKELQEILNKGLEHGADFVELFFENTIANSIQYVSGKVTSTNRSNIYGVAARLLKGPQVVYGYTNNFDEAANLVEKLSKSDIRCVFSTSAVKHLIKFSFSLEVRRNLSIVNLPFYISISLKAINSPVVVSLNVG